MSGRTCVECGLVAELDETACRICGGLVPDRPWTDELGGETVALPPGPREVPARGEPGAWTGDVLRVVLNPGEYILQLRRGEEVLLGRGAGLSPHAGYLSGFEDVSRRHVTLWLDRRGQAYVRDEYSTNGTTRGGSRLAPGAQCRLRGGDLILIGASLRGAVEVLDDPSGVGGTAPR